VAVLLGVLAAVWFLRDVPRHPDLAAASGPGPATKSDPKPAPPNPPVIPAPPRPATDFTRWRERNSWKEEHAHVGVVAFSPDGKKLAVTADPGRVRLRETATGKQVEELSRPSPTAAALAFSPDGRTLAVGGWKDMPVILWDFAAKQERKLEGEVSGQQQGIVFSADGKRLAAFTWDRLKRTAPGEAALWEVSTGKKLAELPHKERVKELAFSPDNRVLASASLDQTARLWDAATGKDLHKFDHAGAVVSLAFSPDGHTLLTGAPVYPEHLASKATGEAHLWNVDTGKEVCQLPDLTEPVAAVAFAPDGKKVAVFTGDRVSRKTEKVLVWELPPGEGKPRLLQRLAIPPSQIATLGDGRPVFALAFLPDSRTLATWTSAPLVLRLWDAETGKELTKFEGHEPLTFSPDGRLLAGVDRDGVIQIWEAVPRE
jgi:WD40 repeat protein